MRLINDILDIEKIESDKMLFRIVPLDLTSLVEQAVAANSALAQATEVEIRIVKTRPGVRPRRRRPHAAGAGEPALERRQVLSRGGAVEVAW